jgi:hypothetical protein
MTTILSIGEWEEIAEKSTSGDMVWDILASWKKDRGEWQFQLKQRQEQDDLEFNETLNEVVHGDRCAGYKEQLKIAKKLIKKIEIEMGEGVVGRAIDFLSAKLVKEIQWFNKL